MIFIAHVAYRFTERFAQNAGIRISKWGLRENKVMRTGGRFGRETRPA